MLVIHITSQKTLSYHTIKCTKLPINVTNLGLFLLKGSSRLTWIRSWFCDINRRLSGCYTQLKITQASIATAKKECSFIFLADFPPRTRWRLTLVILTPAACMWYLYPIAVISPECITVFTLHTTCCIHWITSLSSCGVTLATYLRGDWWTTSGYY